MQSSTLLPVPIVANYAIRSQSVSKQAILFCDIQQHVSNDYLFLSVLLFCDEHSTLHGCHEAQRTHLFSVGHHRTHSLFFTDRPPVYCIPIMEIYCRWIHSSPFATARVRRCPVEFHVFVGHHTPSRSHRSCGRELSRDFSGECSRQQNSLVNTTAQQQYTCCLHTVGKTAIL